MPSLKVQDCGCALRVTCFSPQTHAGSATFKASNDAAALLFISDAEVRPSAGLLLSIDCLAPSGAGSSVKRRTAHSIGYLPQLTITNSRFSDLAIGPNAVLSMSGGSLAMSGTAFSGGYHLQYPPRLDERAT